MPKLTISMNTLSVKHLSNGSADSCCTVGEVKNAKVNNCIKYEQECLLPQTDRASTFVVDPVKIFLISSFITVQNLIVISHTVCAHVSKKKFGTLGPQLSWDGACLIPRNTLVSHACYHTKFGRSESHHTGVSRGSQNFLGCWSTTAWDGVPVTPRN